jgi:tetratricopeptide (TPR) repeat protein
MNTPTNSSNTFFVVGGTLGREAASYVRRPVDEEILRLTLAGEYCNVLAARQTGKSSLMVRTSERLKREGVRSVIIDLTSIGSAVSPSEWYFGLLSRLKTELKLEVDEQAWWQARSEKSPIQRFSDFLREVVLEEIPEKIVIFVDEIDSTLKLDFTDDFFAAIRAAYNARSRDRGFDRLTFVLLGVARPADLIKDRTRTPYNIGTSVDVTDFQQDELQDFEDILETALSRQGREVLGWALDWTGGQPYLTQKLCAEIIEQANGELREDALSELVENLFLGDQARTETNLRSIRDRASNNPYAAKMLRIYKKVLKSKEVPSEERSIEQNELKLTGLVKVSSQGNLLVRNRIYARTFDLAWVKDNNPVTTGQRLSVILSVITVLALSVAGYFYYQQQNQADEILAQTYTENFTTSASQEIRISGLAGLFELGDEYANQAEELFNGLSHEEQFALFDLATPANVGNELYIVISSNYQEQPNTDEGSEMLTVMADILEQTSVAGATSLTLEIDAWLSGREQAEQGQYETAITFYTNAWEKSVDRKQENASVFFERAVTYTETGKYDLSLNDFSSVIDLDTNQTGAIQEFVLEHEALADYWRTNSGDYPVLDELLVIPTELSPTTVPSPTPTPMPDGWLLYDNFEGEEQKYIVIDGWVFFDDYDFFRGGEQKYGVTDIYSQGYIVQLDGNNTLRCGSSGPPKTIGFYELVQIADSLDDYAIEFDMMVPNMSTDSMFITSLRSNFRLTGTTQTTQYQGLAYVGETQGRFGNNTLQIRYNSPERCCEALSLEDGDNTFGMISRVFDENIWYHQRLEIKGGKMTWYIDGSLQLRAEDSKLKTGAPAITCQNGPFYLDNILIESLE